MLLGLIPFGLATRRGEVFRSAPPQTEAKARTWFWAGIATLVTALALAFAGIIPVEPVAFAHGTKYFLVSLAAVFIVGVYLFGNLDKQEKNGVLMIGVLFVASAIFWAGFEQMGSSFNLFAERFTDRTIFGLEFPAAWFQSVGPIFIIVLSPLVASVWLRLGKRGADPGITGKFGMGLLFLAAGFVVMSVGAQLVGRMGVVGPSWLISTYLLHTIGELCVSPVGLSSISGLAPRRFVSQMMGVWFLATALGNVLAGLMAGSLALDDPGALSGGFLQIAVLPTISGGALLVLALVWKRVKAGKVRTRS